MCCVCINFYFNGRENMIPGRLVLEITVSFKLVAKLSVNSFGKSAVKYFLNAKLIFCALGK